MAYEVVLCNALPLLANGLKKLFECLFGLHRPAKHLRPFTFHALGHGFCDTGKACPALAIAGGINDQYERDITHAQVCPLPKMQVGPYRG